MSTYKLLGVPVYLLIGVPLWLCQTGLVDAAEGGAPLNRGEEPSRREGPSPLPSQELERLRPLLQAAAEEVRQTMYTGNFAEDLDRRPALRDVVTRFFEMLDTYYHLLHGSYRPEDEYVPFYKAAREKRLRRMLEDREAREMVTMYLELAAGDMGTDLRIWNTQHGTLPKRSFVTTVQLLRRLVGEERLCSFLESRAHQYLFHIFYSSLLKRHTRHGLPLLHFDRLVLHRLRAGQLAADLQDRRKCQELLRELVVGNSVLTTGGLKFPSEPSHVCKQHGPRESPPRGIQAPEVSKAPPAATSPLGPGASPESRVPTETSKSSSASSRTETMRPTPQQGTQPSGAPSASVQRLAPQPTAVLRGRSERRGRGPSALPRTRPLSAVEPSAPSGQPSGGVKPKRWSLLARFFREGYHEQPGPSAPSQQQPREPTVPSAPPEHEYSPPSIPVTVAAQFTAFPSEDNDLSKPPPYNPGTPVPSAPSEQQSSEQAVPSAPPEHEYIPPGAPVTVAAQFTAFPSEDGDLPNPPPYNPAYMTPQAAAFLDYPAPHYERPPPPQTPYPEPTPTTSRTATSQSFHAREGPGAASGYPLSHGPSPPASSARGMPPTEGQEGPPAGARPPDLSERFRQLTLGARPKTSSPQKHS